MGNTGSEITSLATMTVPALKEGSESRHYNPSPASIVTLADRQSRPSVAHPPDAPPHCPDTPPLFCQTANPARIPVKLGPEVPKADTDVAGTGKTRTNRESQYDGRRLSLTAPTNLSGAKDLPSFPEYRRFWHRVSWIGQGNPGTRYNGISWTEYNKDSRTQIQRNSMGVGAREARMDMGDSLSDCAPMRGLSGMAADHTRMIFTGCGIPSEPLSAPPAKQRGGYPGDVGVKARRTVSGDISITEKVLVSIRDPIGVRPIGHYQLGLTLSHESLCRPR